MVINIYSLSSFDFDDFDVLTCYDDDGCMLKGGADSCEGDSGAPYFIGSGQNATQHGIAIWGYGCADPDYPGKENIFVLNNASRKQFWYYISHYGLLLPGVYTQVSSFIQWIVDNWP